MTQGWWGCYDKGVHGVTRLALVVGMSLLGGVNAAAQDLTFSATVDKIAVSLQETFTLTVTITGDIQAVGLPPLKVPEAFGVVSRSRSSTFQLHQGRIQRAITARYLLVAREAGTFTLGPFQLEYQHQMIATEPIEITVEKPVIPPSVTPKGGRFSI